MLITRPIRQSDLPALLDLANLTGFGLTTLPRDRELLLERILDSEHAFLRQAPRPRGDTYLFVMEDTANHRVIGTCGITSKVGGFEPFYAYRLQTTIRKSEMINVKKEIQTLTLVAEHNGPCEIGSLFLHPDYRRHQGAGRLLSLSRFLFIAEYPNRFDPAVIAEMPGIIDDQGRSPFWDALGKHFFEIDFPKADYLSMVNKTFIADLMPQHPIYVALLPPEAQAVISKVHPDTQPALKLLLSEGFHLTDQVDIFEAGPVVEVKRDEIRTVQESRKLLLEEIAPVSPNAPILHILNPALSISTRAPLELLPSGNARLDAETATSLGLVKSSLLRHASTHASTTPALPPITGPFSGKCGMGVPPMTPSRDSVSLQCVFPPESKYNTTMNTNPYINNTWLPGEGPAFTRLNPTTHEPIWQAPAASIAQVHQAVEAAAEAAPAWSRLTTDQRAAYLEKFGQAITARAAELQQTISLETGKPLWESKTEVEAVQRKVTLTLHAHKLRQSPTITPSPAQTAATRYKPLGVAAVLGPFNIPAHLPNGQILPALLAGNTIVFKPSELAPNTAALYTQCMHEADLPPGVFNLIHGARDQGAALATHPLVNAVYFTGSHAGGVALNTALAAHPEKLLALEMGGNNPLIAANIMNLDAAAYAIVQSAFITAGQRCTCARRLILINSPEADRLLERLLHFTKSLRIAPYTSTPEPFIGPVISAPAAENLLLSQIGLITHGAQPLLPLKSLGPINMLTPAILDVTHVKDRADEELFGPLLQLIRVNSFDEALAEANNTKYGLAAALLSDDKSLYERFYAEVRAGIINWNKPTTGAASDLPFGGVAASGNHRPAGFFAIDFCADPIASLESPTLKLPDQFLPGINS